MRSKRNDLKHLIVTHIFLGAVITPSVGYIWKKLLKHHYGKLQFICFIYEMGLDNHETETGEDRAVFGVRGTE